MDRVSETGGERKVGCLLSSGVRSLCSSSLLPSPVLWVEVCVDWVSSAPFRYRVTIASTEPIIECLNISSVPCMPAKSHPFIAARPKLIGLPCLPRVRHRDFWFQKGKSQMEMEDLRVRFQGSRRVVFIP